MKESRRINQKSNLNSNKGILFNKYVTYINALSNSIKKYYKISINIIKNKSNLIKSLEEVLNIFGQENNISKEIKEIFNQLNLNINCEKNNLINFLKDSKLIFKEMKEYHNSTINNVIEKRYNTLNTSNSYSPLKNNSYKINQNSKKYYKTENNQNIAIFHKINLKTNKKIIHPKYYSHNIQSLIEREPNQIYDKDKNMTSNEFNLNNNNNLLEEMVNLKKNNKNYELQIKKLNLELKKFNNSYNGNNSRIININDSQKTQDELILNKNKIISSSKQDLERNNKKRKLIFRNFKAAQTEIKFLKEENNKLFTLISSDKILINEFNNLMEENNRLKSTIEAINSHYNAPNNNLNYRIDFNNDNSSLKKEIKLHKNKTNPFINQLKKEKNTIEDNKKE